MLNLWGCAMAEPTFCTVTVDNQSVAISLQDASVCCPDEFRAMMDAADAVRRLKARDEQDFQFAKAVLLQRMERLRAALILKYDASM